MELPDQERWQTVRVLFHSALEHEPEERPALLDHVCGGDADLRHQVELLLARELEARSFMETPTLDEDVVGVSLALVGPRGFADVHLCRHYSAGEKEQSQF